MVPPHSEPGPNQALLDHLQRLKHDLGKYVAMQQRWLGPSPAAEALREAVANDLLRTRRGPAGEQDAWTVWQGFSPVLAGQEALPDGRLVDLAGQPAYAAVCVGMDTIHASLSWLRTDEADPERVQTLHQAAMQVAEGCRELVRAARAAQRTPWPTS